MTKAKYYYNSKTLRYEKQIIPLRVRLLRVILFLSAAAVTGLAISAIVFKFIDSPKEKLLKVQLENSLELNKLYADRYRELEERIRELETRDNTVYRAIFEANPIPDSARAKSIDKKKELLEVSRMANSEIASNARATLNKLFNRIFNQEKSYIEIDSLIKNKEKLIASTPAIQPIGNRDLNRLSSGFGYRVDPVYKTVKFHSGLDFAAPTGTPIYATADGTVEIAGELGNGYGNHVVIDHGFTYKTLYGHMSRIAAKKGFQVKRGEIIGYVGSTGKSTGPHLHYEVFKSNKRLDPIYFFYNDLSPEQYQRILKLAASKNQTFD